MGGRVESVRDGDVSSLPSLGLKFLNTSVKPFRIGLTPERARAVDALVIAIWAKGQSAAVAVALTDNAQDIIATQAELPAVAERRDELPIAI